MKLFNRFLMASLAMLLFAGLAVAQQKPEQKAQQIIPLKVQIVLSEYAGQKKISSLPYTLGVSAVTSGNPGKVSTHLRLGVQVPIATGANQFQYTNIGTDIDCQARALGDGVYQLYLSIERKSASLPDAQKRTEGLQVPRRPVVRNFRVSSTLTLRKGQSDESTVATDPVSGHVLRVSVTLHVRKSAS